MDVSIIIINYNTYLLTCNCIQSVLDYTTDIQYEIILIDNASDECDASLFLEKYPQIKLIKSPVNVGFAAGNNLGIKESAGKNILLLNSDTILLENSIQYIFNECNKIDNLGAATVQLTFPEGAIQHAAQKFPSVLAHFLLTTRLWKMFKNFYKRKSSKYSFDKSFNCDWIWGTFFYFPRNNLKYMNGQLATTFFMYSEDVEWCYHFKMNKLNNYYFNGSKIIHLGGGSSTARIKKKLIIKNHLKFIKIYYGYFPYLVDRLLFSIDEIESTLRKGFIKQAG